MPKADLDNHFKKIDDLVRQIDELVPEDSGFNAVTFRADLAGLLVVTITATYETCVKQVIYRYAECRHVDFGTFARNNYDKINSKISVADLRKYCKTFSPHIHHRFKSILNKKKQKVLYLARKDIEKSYQQILDWRHDFAHEWNRNATIKDVVDMHRAGKIILYVFDESCI
jgi:hypothetical protein